MARWVGDVRQGISGKFDLIRREVFERIGGYDTERFSFAGEDMDLFLRLSQQGEVFVAPTRVLHLHNQSKRTSGWELFTKTFQLAESFGALFRKWGTGLRRAAYASHWTHHLSKYLYPFLPLLLLWPLPVGLAFLVLTNLAHADGFNARSPMKLLLVLLNPLIFLAGFAGTVRGVLTGKQRYSQNK
jgi:GT2 family glycosyltransferase